MRRIRAVLTVAACALGTAGALAPSAGAVLVRLGGGRLAGVQFRAGAGPAGAPGAILGAGPLVPDNGDVDYHGGPVLHTTKPYLVFWDPSGTGVAASTQAVLKRYLSDVSTDGGETDDTYGVGRQYYDTTGFADAGQSFDATTQAISDTQAYPAQDTGNCPTVAGYSTCVSDAQIEAELTRLIAADSLPTGIGAGAPLYFVVTPPTTDVCFDAADCANTTSPNGFCAYHSSYDDGPNDVIYASIPLSILATSAKSCQDDNTTALQEPNGDVGDVVADDLSHENNEAITDPLGNAWYDTSSQQEAADNCEAYGATADPAAGFSPDAYIPIGGDATPVPPASYGTLYDQSINGGHYYTQTLWSNGNVNCEPHPAAATLTPAFGDSAPVAPGTAVGFDPTSSVASAGVSSATWSFGDGATAFASGALAKTAHAYAAAGGYTVTLTLVDADGNVASVSHAVAVGVAPAAAFHVSPPTGVAGVALSFNGSASSDPNPGATIGSYAWSFGDGAVGTGATATHVFAKAGRYQATLTVTDSLGLTASTSEAVTVAAPGRITRVSVEAKHHREYLVVTVSAPGTVRFGSKSVHATRTASFKLKLTRAQQRRRAKHHKVTLKVTVVYTPQAGPLVRSTRTVTVPAA
jgi:PKD repeat protein